MATHLKNLIQQSVSRAGISKEVGAAVICNEFDKIMLEIFGDKAKNKVKAQYIKNGTLTVAVLSSVWGQEIKLHEQEILEKLQKKVGINKVVRLRFLV
jgi:predicted nucleic acid-binding Zn ribbon protein